MPPGSVKAAHVATIGVLGTMCPPPVRSRTYSSLSVPVPAGAGTSTITGPSAPGKRSRSSTRSSGTDRVTSVVNVIDSS